MHSVEKWKTYSDWKKFRQINYLVISLANPLLPRNFCQKCVRVFFFTSALTESSRFSIMKILNLPYYLVHHELFLWDLIWIVVPIVNWNSMNLIRIVFNAKVASSDEFSRKNALFWRNFTLKLRKPKKPKKYGF